MLGRLWCWIAHRAHHWRGATFHDTDEVDRVGCHKCGRHRELRYTD
jgi:hypothetical protein